MLFIIGRTLFYRRFTRLPAGRATRARRNAASDFTFETEPAGLFRLVYGEVIGI